jgi:hypothetical protein
MLNVVLPSVTMLNVMAPIVDNERESSRRIIQLRQSEYESYHQNFDLKIAKVGAEILDIFLGHVL